MADAIAVLDRTTKIKPQPLFVLTGDEDFLRRLVRERLVHDLLADADPSFALSTFEGEKADWSTVKSELDTLPFLSPRRVVIIEQADPFVTKVRPKLEQYATAEGGRGVLILETKSWPGNTKLSKLVPETATVQCKSPQSHRVAAWCKTWAKDRYQKEFVGDAADVLVELVGNGLGQLDREIEKLATFANEGKITRDHVEQLVGRSRQAETFKIFDAIGAGQPATALTILGRLLVQGEDAMAVLGAFSWQMRRLAAVSRGARTGLSVSEAMQRAGVPPFAQKGIEQQLRHLGKTRMDKIYDWLLEADLGMKGSSPLSPRIQLEQLVLRLACKEGVLSA